MNIEFFYKRFVHIISIWLIGLLFGICAALFCKPALTQMNDSEPEYLSLLIGLFVTSFIPILLLLAASYTYKIVILYFVLFLKASLHGYTYLFHSQYYSHSSSLVLFSQNACSCLFLLLCFLIAEKGAPKGTFTKIILFSSLLIVFIDFTLNLVL